jgi:predicted Zn-dependent protease
MKSGFKFSVSGAAALAKKVAAVAGAAVVLGFGPTGCTKGSVISTKEEVKIGRQAADEIEKRYRVETDTPDARRVKRVGERLLMHSDQRPGVPYTFGVIDLPEVNAIALPGGPVYVFKGLLDLVGDDDDALAAVMGHEIGHTNGRHIVRQFTKQLEAQLLLTVLLQGRAAGLQNAASLGFELLTYKFSRDDELDADRRGLSYTHHAGFDPNGLVRFFEKLQTVEKRGGPPEFLRTHPVTGARIDRAKKVIETKEFKYGQ